jgi:glutathionylspermidine synthase
MTNDLNKIIEELNRLILNDSSLTPEVFERLLAQQHELGLLQGDRPTCPFLRPHILSRTRYDEIKSAASVIAGAFEKVAATALDEGSLLDQLNLTFAERAMALIDPGYERLCVTSRLDTYVTESGFKFLEYNAESPAGVGDQMQLEKVLFTVPSTKHFLSEHTHWRPKPHEQLLTALVSAYRDWGGEAQLPQIAIVDCRGVATAAEFRVLQQYFEIAGYSTRIVDPQDLEYDGNVLTAGDFQIDIVYKRVVIHEFLNEADRDHPLIRAYADGRVCMANSFRSKLAHKKSGFAILSDPSYEELFSPREIEVIRRHIPWTRMVKPGHVDFENVEVDLLHLLEDERQRFVLKPNDDYGGHGVFLGWELEANEWDKAISTALERPYVAQERVAVDKVSIPMFSDKVTVEDMFIDFNPFLFHNEVEGALVRLSHSSLLNVTSGGGQTALVVMEEY